MFIDISTGKARRMMLLVLPENCNKAIFYHPVGYPLIGER
jgi:hypothetical protein